MPARFDRFARWGCCLLLAGVLGAAQAAELGEPAVRSYRGQPLVADIELTALADPAVALAVRLAHPDVYKGANIGRHPVLASLTMSVMVRDGRQFLHITSLAPVESEYVNLFLELGEGERKEVRSAILWISPDPAPPPRQTPPLPAAAPAPAPVVNAERALEAAMARAAALARARPTPPPAACPQVLPNEQGKACAAMDYKNGLLSAQIVDLEDKVGRLQTAVEGRKPLVASAAAAPVKPAPASPARPVQPAKTLPAEESDWIVPALGALAVLFLLGGAAAWLLRRKRGKHTDLTAEQAASASAAWYARLLGRLKASAAPPQPPREEPGAP